MKTRLPSVLLFAALTLSALAATPAAKPGTNPTVTTTKRSAIKVGNSAFAVPKGTKIELLGREGKDLIVKYHSSQGRIPYADTDFVLPADEQTEDAAAEEPPAAPVAPPKPAAPKPAPAATTPAPATKTPPPALAPDGNPTSHYGKMVQKAKQAEAAHNDKLVKPADEVTDEKPKK